MGELPTVSAGIRRAQGQFTPAERKVARQLMSGSPSAGLESSSRLAELVGVSGPTVIRFVNRLGYATYADFQRDLRAELDARVQSPVTFFPSRSELAERDDGVAVDRERLLSLLTQTLDAVPVHELNTAVALLSEKNRKVMAFGGWFSHVLARHFVALAQEVRSNVYFVGSSPSERAAAVVDSSARTVAVVFDFRRYEDETALLARKMHERRARIILFTDQWLSPIADIATVVLPAAVGTPSPFESLVPPLALVELIVTRVIPAAGEGTRARFERFSDAADDLVPNWGRDRPKS